MDLRQVTSRFASTGTASAVRSLPYEPALDGLRGLAISLVMVFHADETGLRGGFLGVDIFFVLSGFLITTLLLQEWRSTQRIDLRQFIYRRALRLMPAFLVLLVGFTTVSLLVLDPDRARSNAIDAIIALCSLSNWAMAFNLHPPNYLAHTWSLSIEEQYYLLWPLALMALLHRGRSMHQVATIVAVAAVATWILRVALGLGGSSLERLHYGLDTRADALLAGCLLGLLLSRQVLSSQRRYLTAPALGMLSCAGILGLLVLAALIEWPDRHVHYWYSPAVALLTALVIADIMLSERSRVRRALSTPVLVWLGSLSYGLYLWHAPIDRAMAHFGFSPLGILTLGSVLALGAASCSYYLLERPLRRFRTGLVPRRVAPSANMLTAR
jgi:peptidoglycan/LPS O-acetylase OafA/YrhL